MRLYLSLFFYTLLFTLNASADSVFTYRDKESKHDTRHDYDRKLMELALQKTEQKYGPFKLQPSMEGANEKRVVMLALSGVYENFFFKAAASAEMLEKFAYVPFPIDRGIVGYRVAFVSEQTKNKLASVKTLEDLKQFSILQGVGWHDTKILEQSGFKVIQFGHYDPMFKMIANNRADLFTRGANEIRSEWLTHYNMKNLTYDETILLHYPFPRFLFTQKNNTKAIERITEGIMMAYEDGSLLELWNHEYQASIDFSSLKTRRVFELNNPVMDLIDPTIMQYNYDPFE